MQLPKIVEEESVPLAASRLVRSRQSAEFLFFSPPSTPHRSSPVPAGNDPLVQVQFPLKFGVGTRKLPMRLRFSTINLPRLDANLQYQGLQVQLANRPDVISLESELSKPFVVITNEYQWEEVAGVLLLLELFGEQVASL